MSCAFEFSPQKLIYGGAALGYHDGQTVMVPLALPGERVKVQPIRKAKGVVRARLLDVLDAAPERVTAPCPYFGRCGGCQYQHLPPELQATTKREILREILRRLGGIDWHSEIIIHSAPPTNYRNQVQLKVRCRASGEVKLGFFEAGSHDFCPIENCLLLSPRLNQLLGRLLESTSFAQISGCQEIELLADDRDEHVAVTLRGQFAIPATESLAKRLLRELPEVRRVAIEHGRAFRVLGNPHFEYAIDGFRYRISPGSFFQVSRFLLKELLSAVTNDVRGNLVLDLYAGVGLFTLPLAKRFDQAVGVEVNESSTADLRANADAHGFRNIRAICGTSFDFLRRFAQVEPDLLILDPPRGGVDLGSLRLLAGLHPRQIRYVSCSPPTLARDLRFLVARGYRLNSVELFDFFPQTYHIETLAKLTLHTG
ncbi:MAG TPA: 23S rRNA (uracil(1939)-C(5))-methyltransferase RlmD [Terriglobia bacterium]|nr:23S rRNA (uracil(1939)-C(5))-methyltransferase RlmD [Terriglobia bacterium]